MVRGYNKENEPGQHRLVLFVRFATFGVSIYDRLGPYDKYLYIALEGHRQAPSFDTYAACRIFFSRTRSRRFESDFTIERSEEKVAAVKIAVSLTFHDLTSALRLRRDICRFLFLIGKVGPGNMENLKDHCCILSI